MPFGYLLKHFRDEKGFTLRQLGEIVGVDHGYLSCLERKAKQRPTEELVQKLVGAMELSGRDAWLLAYVGKYRAYVDVGMVEYMLADPAITTEAFSWAVAVRFRRPGLDYPVLFGCAHQVEETVDDFLSQPSVGVLQS